MEFWPLIHAERAALVDDLEKLDEAQWATRSLCSEWGVREVVPRDPFTEAEVV